MLNIAGNPIKDITVNLSFLSSGSKVVEYTPSAGYLVEILENLLFHVLSNYACKFAKTFSPSHEGHLKNVNLLYFLLKIQISNGCNVLNIAGNPMKDIIVNLSFLSSGSKVVQNIPYPGWVSGGNFGKSTFFMYCPIMHAKFAINLFPITWGPFQNVNLLYFLLKIQISNGCNVLNIAGNPIKDIIVNLSFLSSGSKFVQNIPCPAGYLVDILENLLFHVLSNYACKFAINLFPITWGPFQNVKLLYFSIKNTDI